MMKFVENYKGPFATEEFNIFRRQNNFEIRRETLQSRIVVFDGVVRYRLYLLGIVNSCHQTEYLKISDCHYLMSEILSNSTTIEI